MTTVTPNLDTLLATARDDRGAALLAYSTAMLAAKTLDDLANEEFAKLAKRLGHNASKVRSDFKRILGFRRALAAFSPEKLRIAIVEETATRKADALYTHGGLAAREFCGHSELQPELALTMVALEAQRRASTTAEEREAVLEQIQSVQAEGERLAHRARAAASVVEELMRKRDKIGMISQGELFVALEQPANGVNP